jgi:hypothetical protein
VSPNPLNAAAREPFPAGRVGVAKLGVAMPLGPALKRGVVPGGATGLLGPGRVRAGVVKVFKLQGRISECVSE